MRLRNNISTMTSQFINTILFIIIAFTGMVPLMR
ncbi:VUT family protein [Virgibacillus proomii]|nr:VUT family protein [Virgibacillus proomii]